MSDPDPKRVAADIAKAQQRLKQEIGPTPEDDPEPRPPVQRPGFLARLFGRDR